MPRKEKYNHPLPKKNLYHIILINHGIQLKHLFYTDTEQKVYKKFKELIKESRKVAFPIKYNNEKVKIVPSEYELVIIKVNTNNENPVTLVKDNYGKFVEYQTSSSDWLVLDRVPYDMEETFWVYGYHPRMQRKTFSWICDEFIAKNAKDKHYFKTVVVYLNKVLVETNGKLEMVICKNQSDAARLYNEIEKLCMKKRYKTVVFLGDVSWGPHMQSYTEKIQKLTHWKEKKIKRTSTRP